VFRDETTFPELFISHLLIRNARIKEDWNQLFNSNEKRRVLLPGRRCEATPSLDHVGPASAICTLQRTVHSTQEPANAERNKNRRIGLRFDRVAQRTFKRRSGSSGGGHGVIRYLRSAVPRLSIQILCGAFDLVGNSFNLGLGVADNTAKSLLRLSADVPGRASDPILIHNLSPMAMCS
jgi:hypothetical protein